MTDPAEQCIGTIGSPRPMLPIERSQSEYSALQVVDAEHEKVPALQVVPEQGGDAPQLVFDDDKFYDPLTESNISSLEVAPPQGSLPEVVPTSEPGPPVPWYRNWRRKRLLAIIAITIAIIVAVVLGAVLSTRANNNSQSKSGSGSGSTVSRESACNGTVCPQILSAAVLGLNTTNDRKLFVFARGDGAIYFNWAHVANLSSSGGWPADSRWSALLGGPFVSQPTAISWHSGSRVSVAAMTDNNRQVQMTKFIVDEKGPGGFTVDGWKDLGGPVGSPLATCAINGTRADYYALDGTEFLHNLSHRNGTVDMWKHPDQLGIAAWDTGEDLKIVLNQTTRPAVACRPSYFVHDLAYYDDKAAVRHGMWAWHLPGDHWTEFTDLGGKFHGEPTLIAVGADRVDFFGIGQDAAMYHFIWEGGNHSSLESLGGAFHSAASAVATGSGLVAPSSPGGNNTAARNIRIDVVALGNDDLIYHRVLLGREWVSDWENLGVVGNSAPMLVHYGGGSSELTERVGLFVVAYDGQVKQATWTVSSEPSWKDLQWTSMGGAMTSDFYH